MELQTIDSLCSLISSGGTPSRECPDFYTDELDGHLWVKSKELLDRPIEDTEEKISDEGLNSSSAKYFPKETVLIAMYGANVCQLGWLKRPATVNQAVCGLVVNGEIASSRFVFYALLQTREALATRAQGAAQQNLNQGLIREFRIPSPPLPVQRKIAAILSAYDDLIENNLRRIKILEEMAQNLYREWFVKFRFPGHQHARFTDSPLGRIPEGWEVKRLLSIADVTYGFAFKSREFNSDGVGWPVVRIRDVLAGTTETFSAEEVGEKYLVENGDILVGMDGDFHMGFWVGGHAHLVQRVARFRPRDEIGRYQLFLALRDPIQHFNATITGTTVAHLGDEHIRTITIIRPQVQLRDQLDSLLEPMLDQILGLRRKNEILRRSRDLLLPRLISGEVDVSKLDIADLGEVRA